MFDLPFVFVRRFSSLNRTLLRRKRALLRSARILGEIGTEETRTTVQPQRNTLCIGRRASKLVVAACSASIESSRAWLSDLVPADGYAKVSICFRASLSDPT